MSEHADQPASWFAALRREAERRARADGGDALAWYDDWAEACEQACAAGDQGAVGCFADLLVAWHARRTSEPEPLRSVADVIRSFGFRRYGQ